MFFEQMKYFVEIVKTGSFTKAAEQCYISQSAISQQMQFLEKTVGVPLMIRGNRRFRLTPAGEYFYHQSAVLLGEAERIRQETARVGGQKSGGLRFGYQKTYAGTEVRRAVADFSQQHPEESLSITGQSHEALTAMLKNGLLDLSLNDCRRKPSDLYEHQPIFTSRTCAELSSRSPFADAQTITPEDLCRIPCILVASQEQQKNEQTYYRNALGFHGSFLFADDLNEARMLVTANSGFLLSEYRDGCQHGTPEFRCIPLWKAGKPVRHLYCAFWKKENGNPSVKAFAALLASAFATPADRELRGVSDKNF